MNNTYFSTSAIRIEQSTKPAPIRDTLPELPSLPVGLLGFVGFFTLFAVIVSLLLTCVYKATIPRRRSRKWDTSIRSFRFRRPRHSSSNWTYRKMQHSPNSSSPTGFGVSSGFHTPNSAAFTSAVATPMTASFPPKSPWLAAGLSQRGATHSGPLSPRTPLNTGCDEESLIVPPSPENSPLSDSARGPDGGRRVLWGFGSVVGAVAEKIVRWTVDAGGEDELLLPITEKERNSEVEF
jgi:hypothetical protein